MSAQIIPFSLSQLFTLDKHSDQGPNEMIMSFQFDTSWYVPLDAESDFYSSTQIEGTTVTK